VAGEGPSAAAGWSVLTGLAGKAAGGWRPGAAGGWKDWGWLERAAGGWRGCWGCWWLEKDWGWLERGCLVAGEGLLGPGGWRRPTWLERPLVAGEGPGLGLAGRPPVAGEGCCCRSCADVTVPVTLGTMSKGGAMQPRCHPAVAEDHVAAS
jgi:hypothetical protein